MLCSRCLCFADRVMRRGYEMPPGVEVIENTGKFRSRVCLQAPRA